MTRRACRNNALRRHPRSPPPPPGGLGSVWVRRLTFWIVPDEKTNWEDRLGLNFRTGLGGLRAARLELLLRAIWCITESAGEAWLTTGFTENRDPGTNEAIPIVVDEPLLPFPTILPYHYGCNSPDVRSLFRAESHRRSHGTARIAPLDKLSLFGPYNAQLPRAQDKTSHLDRHGTHFPVEHVYCHRSWCADNPGRTISSPIVYRNRPPPVACCLYDSDRHTVTR